MDNKYFRNQDNMRHHLVSGVVRGEKHCSAAGGGCAEVVCEGDVGHSAKDNLFFVTV